MHVCKRFWNDECGATLSAELTLITTLVVIGMIVGLATLRNSVVQEFGDTAMGIGVLNQSYTMTTSISGNNDPMGTPSGEANWSFADGDVLVTVNVFDSAYTDNNDFCDHVTPGTEGSDSPDLPGEAPACMVMNVTSVDEATN